MTYSEKLLDPRWQKKRLEILQRDEFTCQNCWDTKKTLHVHHSFYISGYEPWYYPEYSLFTLCKECHENNDTVANNEIIFRILGGLKDDFIKGCAVEVFSKYNVNDLIYLLWDAIRKNPENKISYNETFDIING